MTDMEYNKLFHRANINLVAFKQVNDCDSELRGMVEMAVAAEREECAKLIEAYPEWIGANAKQEISAAIRARGNT